MKEILAVSVRACDNITMVHGTSSSKTLIDKSVKMTRTCIEHFHHPSRKMNDAKVINKNIL